MKEYKVITMHVNDEINPETSELYTEREYAKKVEDTLNSYANKGYKVLNIQTLSPDNPNAFLFYIVLEREI